jgi:phosphohistidine phosphatase
VKTLLILRHAKSDWSEPALTDHERPLNKRGRRDAPRIGQLLREVDLAPDLIVSSTAKRACETVEKLIEAADYAGDVRFTDALYLAHPEEYAAVLQCLPEAVDSVMVVGHNPGLEHLLAALTGIEEPLPTAALVQLELSIPDWRQFDLQSPGTLVNRWLPRELD